MATIFRTPIYCRVERRREVFAELPRNLLLSTLAAVAVVPPFKPGVQLSAPTIRRNIEAFNPPNLPLSTLDFQSIAASNIETLPLYPKRAVTDTNVRNLLLSLPNVLPPGKTRHESAPARRASAGDTNSLNLALLLPASVASPPFYPIDIGQTPVRRQVSDTNTPNWLLQKPPAPFFALQFESIGLRRQVSDTSQPSPWVLLSTVVLPPFAQTDWMPPVGYKQRFLPADQYGPIPDLPPAVIPPTPPSTDQPSGGWWPDYGQPGGKRKRVTQETSEIVAEAQRVADKIKALAETRKQEAYSRNLTEQIRALLDEQDQLAGRLAAIKAEIALDDEEIALILALAG